MKSKSSFGAVLVPIHHMQSTMPFNLIFILFVTPSFQELRLPSFRNKTIDRVNFVYPAGFTSEIYCDIEKDVMILYRKDKDDLDEVKRRDF